MPRFKKLFRFLTVLVLAQAACSMSRDIPHTPTPDLPATFTLLAGTRTAAAMLTSTPPTPVPTHTPAPKATLPCDAVQFAGDVTLPDQSILNFGATHNKTWRLKNVGACTWTKQYIVTFERGAQLGTTASYPLPQDVPPGATVDLTIPITAPDTYGYYQSFWVLRNAAGQIVNRIDMVDPTFWIKVIASDASFDFVREACNAIWAGTASGTLRCPGSRGDTAGYIIPVPYHLENPIQADDGGLYPYGLLISSGAQSDSSISGTYIVTEIRRGDRLRTQIGCLHAETASQCNIRFQITIPAQASGEPSRNLVEYYEIADGQVTSVDIDLSNFIGQKIPLTLTVITIGKANDNAVFWIAPRIVHSQP